MLSDKERLNAELDALLVRLASTPEYLEVEGFLMAHPDVELSFMTLFKVAYNRHTHSVRIMRGKRERSNVKKAEFRPNGPPELVRAKALLQQVKDDVPNSFTALAQEILQSGWDLNRHMPFTLDEEKTFMQDMADGKGHSDGHRMRLEMSGAAYVRWLIRKHAVPEAKHGSR